MSAYINSVPIHTDKKLATTSTINWKKMCFATILGIAGSIGGVASGIALSGVKGNVYEISNSKNLIKEAKTAVIAKAGNYVDYSTRNNLQNTANYCQHQDLNNMLNTNKEKWDRCQSWINVANAQNSKLDSIPD